MDIREIYYQNANPQKAAPMSAYMRNKFPFLGLTRTDRKELDRDFLRIRKKDICFDWKFIADTTELPEREFFYLALGYLSLNQRLIKPEEFKYIEELIMKKSWWDSVDSIAPVVGSLCIKYPGLVDDYIVKWMSSDNFWLVRSSIIFQLKYKKETNLELLSKVIIINKSSKEFFINKAIGWALREYSKTDPEWVSEFIKMEKLSSLSEREAMKWINKSK